MLFPVRGQDGDAREAGVMLSNSCRSVWLVVFPGFELLDMSGPLCALNLATSTNRASYLAEVISVRGGPIASCSGVPIHTRKASPRKLLDTLLIAGGPADRVFEGDEEAGDEHSCLHWR